MGAFCPVHNNFFLFSFESLLLTFLLNVWWHMSDGTSSRVSFFMKCLHRRKWTPCGTLPLTQTKFICQGGGPMYPLCWSQSDCMYANSFCCDNLSQFFLVITHMKGSFECAYTIIQSIDLVKCKIQGYQKYTHSPKMLCNFFSMVILSTSTM